jgi:hypothetical protein
MLVLLYLVTVIVSETNKRYFDFTVKMAPKCMFDILQCGMYLGLILIMTFFEGPKNDKKLK